jgi:hypothetical protein
MNPQVINLLKEIATLSLEDQREVNKGLVENLRRTQKIAAIQLGAKFNIGDKVMFDAGRKGLITMQVTSFSRDGSKIKGPQIGGLRSGCIWTVGTAVTSLRKI